MYPYDENEDLRRDDENSGGENANAGASANEPVTDEKPQDGEYRIVRPDENRKNSSGDGWYSGSDKQTSYRDAAFVPESEATEPPRYYAPSEPEEKPKKEKKQGFTFAKVAALCLCCALLGGVAGGIVGSNMADGAEATTPPVLTTTNTPTPVDNLAKTPGGMTGSEVYAMACDQVVGITTEITTQTFFGMTSTSAVTGSGFVITADGYIMTNYHVVESAYKGGYDVTVMLHDGSEYVADIIGFDNSNDIAILKINAAGLSAVTLGNSDNIQVGEAVYAIGNPLGELTYTMTTGTVSATDRVIKTEESAAINMFQIDAAVNSGNSGGPVYNSAGQVIGVVTAKASSSGVEGIGFAIPINDAVSIANDIIQHGYVTGKAFLGVKGQDVDYYTSQYYNMPRGMYVREVTAGSAAEKAGVKVGDIITAVGDTAVTSSDELSSAVKSHSAGSTENITVWRGGEYLTLSVTFDEYVPETDD